MIKHNQYILSEKPHDADEPDGIYLLAENIMEALSTALGGEGLNRTVVADVIDKVLRLNLMTINLGDCSEFHRGPFVRLPGGVRCVACKTDLPQDIEKAAVTIAYEIVKELFRNGAGARLIIRPPEGGVVGSWDKISAGEVVSRHISKLLRGLQ